VGHCSASDVDPLVQKIQDLFVRSGPFDYLFIFGSFAEASIECFKKLVGMILCVYLKSN
jgi:hypothetical protein